MITKLSGRINIFMVATTLFAASQLGWSIPATAGQNQLDNNCDNCHQMPPIDSDYRNIINGGFKGNHATHNPPALAPKGACEKCHTGSGSYPSAHRDGFINLTSNLNNSPHPARATYNKPLFFEQTPQPALQTCINVNCHFETVTPLWGSAPFGDPSNCSACHTVPGSSGSHARHDVYFPFSGNGCVKCHPDYRTGLKFAHATSSGHAGRGISVTPEDGSYSGTGLNYLPSQSGSRTFGSCSDSYCHSSGVSVATGSIPANTSANWGSGTLACNGCHGNPPDYANGTPKKNSHAKHATNCSICHNSTTATGTTITGTANHVNRSYNLAAQTGYSFSYTFNANGGSCSGISCHFNGTAQWGGSLGCMECHGGNAASGNPISTGRHTAHINNTAVLGTNFGCVECHAKTVSSDTIVANANNHANSLKDYSGARAGKIAAAGSGRCNTVYCHSTGMPANQYWNMTSANWYSGRTFTCSGCHGSSTLPNGDTAAFESIAGEPVYSNLTGQGQRNSHNRHITRTGIVATTGCAKCHATTVDGTTANRLRDYSSAHINKTRDIAFLSSLQGRYSTNSQQCLNLYCHSPGNKASGFDPPLQGAKWGSTLRSDCSGCHKGSAASFRWMSSGSHNRHVSPNPWAPYRIDCVRCHAATVNPGMSINDQGRHVSGTLEIAYDNTSTAVNGKYLGALTPVSKNPGTAYGSCDNVYCHSNGQNDGGIGITYKQPTWGNRDTGKCGTCHDAQVSHAGSSASQIATGSHGKHLSYNSLAATSVRKCILCHNVGNLPYSGNCTNTCHFGIAKHLDRKISIVVPAELGAAAQYNGSPIPGSGYGTCSGTYCHSNGTSVATATVPANTSPAWGSSAMACNGCHGNPPDYGNGSPKANSHAVHLAHSISDCSICHFATTSTGNSITDLAKHVNKVYELQAKPGYSFTYLYNAAGGSCSSISCHADAQWGAGGAGGTDCINCHGHSAGFEYETGRFSAGKGTWRSHASHTQNDGDNAKGPNIACDGCHDTGNLPYFKTGSDSNGDGKYTLAETDVCNTCHSPGGPYDGVNSATYGAKTNWKFSIYSSGSIRSGKEKWCASCHDSAPSVILGISAPNIAGNETEPFAYGAGWGYYKTGHGLPSGETYPAGGGAIVGAGVECNGCHDYSTSHIDGLARTYDDGESTSLDPGYYRQGYRLKQVAVGEGTGATGREPMLVPAPVPTANSANNYRLCVNCHAAGPFVDSGDMNTNLKTDGVNRHEYHLRSVGVGRRFSSDWSNTACTTGDSSQCNSRMTCITCHNVHGSTRPAMVNDGRLVAREPGLKYWYYNPALVSFDSPPDTEPTPTTLPLTASSGTIWSGGSSGNLCSHCHGNTWLTTESRTPFQDVAAAPVLSWMGTQGYESDGVNPDTAGGGSSFTFRVKYSDGNNDAPSVYQVWIDSNDNGAYEPGEKFDLSPLDAEDTNYFDGKAYTLSMPLYRQGDSSLNYRFYFRDATSDATGAPASDRQVVVGNSLPTLSWTGETGFAADGVDPNSGGNGSTFTFRVSYSDLDNEPPDADGVRVLINGAYYTLDPEAGGSYDTGKIYSKGIALSTPGELNYRFVAKDPTGAAATGEPAADHPVTVLASSNNPPLLSWASADCLTEGVRPRTGAINADFEFRVMYSDADDQCPTTIRVTVNGTPYDLTGNDAASCLTGRTYYRTLTLATAGELNYSFSASDGADAATGEPVSGHPVSVISNAYKVRPGGGSGWYSTIASAIAASSASSTILVYPNADYTAATYPEGGLSFTNKPDRTLQSVCGRDLTAISGGSNVISIGSTNVAVDGFSISGGTYGVYFNSGSAISGTVRNCSLHSNATGVYVNQYTTATIEDSLILNNTTRGINSPLASSLLKLYRSTISGNNPGAAAVTGAGISFSSGSGTHIIEDCTISDNRSSGHGGGIYIINGSQVTISRSAINNNSGASGGGIFSNSGSPTLTIADTFIQGNSASSSGGGINVNTGTTTLTNAVLTGNRSALNGGAIWANSSVDCLYCTISGNYANIGGGIYRNAGTVAVKNSIIHDNDAATQPVYRQIYAQSSGWQSVDLNNTLINQVPGSATYPYGYEDLGGNLTESNPDFVTPLANPGTDTPTTAGNFRIQSSSPAINAASGSWTSDHDIFDHTPGSRPKGSAYDMGAHEKE